jgi:hypothetical protein
MHRRILAAIAALTALLVPIHAFAAGTGAPAHAKPAPLKAAPPKVAPADEYFGRMKLSILGITNSIRDTATRESFDPAQSSQYYGSLALTEDALADWAHKYPQDSWIPRRAYDLSHDFWRMHTPDADKMANKCRWILISQFPHDRWAVIARTETEQKVAPVPAAVANQPAVTTSH